MKIAYVGNFRPSHSTENHLALTLEKLGHKVIRIQEDGIRQGDVYAQSKRADLFLFTRTWGNYVTLEDLAALKSRGIPTVSYHLDLYVGLRRDGGIDHDPFWRTDYVFTPDGDPASQRFFEDRGINHVFMKPGVFEEDCYIAEGPARHDVVFVGSYSYHSEWPYRPKLIDWLRMTYGANFELYGNEGRGVVRNHALNALYGATKVVVGDSLCLGFDHPYYWSDRVYETLGRGGFIIHPYIKGLEEEFTDGENIVFYEFGNFNQLREKIDFYIKNDAERLKIRDKGHEFVKNNCTYTQRMEAMLQVVTKEGAKV